MTRRPSRFSGWLAAGALFVSVPAFAQVDAALEGGGTRVSFSGGGATTAWGITPTAQLRAGALTLLGFGNYSTFSTGGWSAQGAATAALLQPVGGDWAVEGGGQLAGTTSGDAGESAQWLAQARLHRLGAVWGGWVGGAAGRATSAGTATGVAYADLALWRRVGGALAVLTVTPTRVGDDARFVDGQVQLRFAAGSAQVTANVGARGWSAPEDAASVAWGNVAAVVPLRGPLALVASAGSYPADPAQALAAGRFVSLSFRLGLTGPGPRPDPGALSRTRLLPPLAEPTTAALTARRDPDGAVLLELRAPGAARVELMGTFTGWAAVEMSAAGGDRWRLRVASPPGAQRVNVRVDGGAWGVPDGLALVQDEFDGVTALLVVP